MTIEDLDINLNTNSVEEYTEELLNELYKLRDQFDISAMNERQLFLEGKLSILIQIINYIEKTV